MPASLLLHGERSNAMPKAVADAVCSPERVMPMLAGASRIRHGAQLGSLVVRATRGDIEISAQNALLDHVFSLCDGTLSITGILARIPEHERATFAEFIQYLFQQGALIDGSLACVHAARYGFQHSPFGAEAPARISDLIARRVRPGHADTSGVAPARVPAAPLDSFFETRTTWDTFADKRIPAKALHQLLWSAAGVVKLVHPRLGNVSPQRTLASAGGMHLLQVFVALCRPVGPYLRGVYRVDYPSERTVVLTLVNSQVDTLPLTIAKPWQLTFATGMIFVAADPVIGAIRYRNRSLQYLYMETGAVLHNVALSAHALGLAQATVGGFYEQPAVDLCRLSDPHIVLGSAVFGARPTARQLVQASKFPNIDFAWSPGLSSRVELPFHLARARLAGPDGDRPYAWGCARQPMLAMRKALAECIEREGFDRPRDIVHGTIDEIDCAIDPSETPLYSSAQYDAPGFPFRRFDRAQQYAWAKGRDLATGRTVRVLAELVFTRSALKRRNTSSAPSFTHATSSGCAAGIDLSDALERALTELIERDAFMRHWLSQTPGLVVPPAQWPQAIREAMRALGEMGCRVTLQQLQSPWRHVALVAVQHETMHFTTVGAAAHHDFERAAESAIDETVSRVFTWFHGHAPSIALPEDVVTEEHHFDLYGQEEYFRCADGVLFPSEASSTARWPRTLAPSTLDGLVRKLVKRGLSPVGIDITPDRHHVDQGRTALRVARVLVPGLLPLSFGYQREPLAMMPCVHPAARMPHPFP